VLDGEIVCLDREGRPRFYDLLFRRGVPCFVVSDVLAAGGRGLHGLRLLDRKKILRRMVPRRSAVVLTPIRPTTVAATSSEPSARVTWKVSLRSGR
jgi:ATP-dependent DNA ligase